MVLGPRLGRIFKRDGGGMPAAHNLTIAAVGGFLLWFGWYGFNPGSTYKCNGRCKALAVLLLIPPWLLAPAVWLLCTLALWFGDTKGKFDVGFTVNGFLAGLVAITASCYWVSPLGAILLGAISGVIVYLRYR
jgi:Amt family ammonium transporter